MSEPGGPYGTQPPYSPPPGYSPPPAYGAPQPYGVPAPAPAYGAPPPPGYPPPTSPPPYSPEHGYAGPQPMWAAAPVPAKKANVWLLGITFAVLLIDLVAGFARAMAEEPDEAAYIVGYTLTGPVVAIVVGGIACLFARPRRITNLALGLALAVLLLSILGSVTPDGTS